MAVDTNEEVFARLGATPDDLTPFSRMDVDIIRLDGHFGDMCDGIAIQIHNIQCWIDPERICLGGGISRNPLFIEGVRDAHRRFNAELLCDFPEVEIVTCRFFNDANLIGAYQHFLHMREKRGA